MSPTWRRLSRYDSVQQDIRYGKGLSEASSDFFAGTELRQAASASYANPCFAEF